MPAGLNGVDHYLSGEATARIIKFLEPDKPEFKISSQWRSGHESIGDIPYAKGITGNTIPTRIDMGIDDEEINYFCEPGFILWGCAIDKTHLKIVHSLSVKSPWNHFIVDFQLMRHKTIETE
uniref:Uncharacterized protein n=1 Tax=Panagrolaimus sp. JU765 TaxID=591449 RepID=A0AC34Q3L7_9BILA